MIASSRLRFVAVVSLFALALAGCSPTPPPTSVPTSGPSAAEPSTAAVAPTPSATSATGLPDLGFKNVNTETAAARGALITREGGTITATGSNGAIYTLVIPPDAMPSTTEIAIYPITGAANLPGGVSVSAGVQITPDGIQLQVPATFTIQFPIGVDTRGLGGLLWTGDADKSHPYPMSITGQTVTMHLFHFTAPAVTPDPLALVGLATCANDVEMDTLIGFDVTVPDQGARRTALTRDLRLCYRGYVAPTMHDAGILPLDAGLAGAGITAYDRWVFALVDAASAVGSQAFTVSPEVAEAKTKAITLIHAWYEAFNQDCVAHKDDPDVSDAILSAGLAMFISWNLTHNWGFDTAANGLDRGTLLDRLCVQIIIDPSRSYSAKFPGTSGDVHVHAGIKIAGGPLRFDRQLHITATPTGTGVASADGHTDAQGDFTAAVPWPTGVDPIQIDILATFDFPEWIARFDRITKDASDLFRFKFTAGREGWSVVKTGTGEQFKAEWKKVGGNGVIHLDGRASTTRANASMFKTFTLPSNARFLRFDVSAELIAGSSSRVGARIEVNGTFKALLSSAIVSNSHNRLSFVTKTVDISKYAGQTVTIYIDQDYGHLGGFDKEIYIDNVRITAV